MYDSVASCRDHRILERHLDALETAIATKADIAGTLTSAASLAREHYLGEEPLLRDFARHEPQLAAKMVAQHEEACEAAQRFEEARIEGHDRDMLALARRFLAIAQHNIIEEERDVFPLLAASE
ncbi:MAG TPA: hypothetical protein VKU19_31185 [Bryobacteraceae bacterium]|nr:hypothetical protein [Bryobacteraceae bacterium]